MCKYISSIFFHKLLFFWSVKRLSEGCDNQEGKAWDELWSKIAFYFLTLKSLSISMTCFVCSPFVLAMTTALEWGKGLHFSLSVTLYFLLSIPMGYILRCMHLVFSIPFARQKEALIGCEPEASLGVASHGAASFSRPFRINYSIVHVSQLPWHH